MTKLIFDKEHFLSFAIIALDFNVKNYTPKDLEVLKASYTNSEWNQFKERVKLECKKIIKYSSNEDDKIKAEVIYRAAELERFVKFQFDIGEKYNQIEGLGSSIPPKMITSKDVEAYERRLKADDNRFNPLQFNLNTYELFLYLAKEYNSKRLQVKFINLYYFLRSDYKPTDNQKLFVFKRDAYIEFIKENYTVSISKFAKSDKYRNQEVDILNDLVNRF